MLTVTIIRNAVDFYSTILGFKPVSFAEGWACVDCDPVNALFIRGESTM